MNCFLTKKDKKTTSRWVLTHPQQWGHTKNKSGNLDNHKGSRARARLNEKLYHLHKTTPLRLRQVAVLPNKYKHRESSKMRKQRNTFQMKRKKEKQDKTSKKDLNEMKISNLSDK